MSPRLHHGLVVLGTYVLAFGLLGLGVHATLDPAGASQGYGVPVDGAALPWVTATGLRDVVLAAATVALLRWRPAALPPFLAASLLLPLGDIAIAARHGESLVAIAPHATGAVGMAVLLALAATDPKLRAPQSGDTLGA